MINSTDNYFNAFALSKEPRTDAILILDSWFFILGSILIKKFSK